MPQASALDRPGRPRPAPLPALPRQGAPRRSRRRHGDRRRAASARCSASRAATMAVSACRNASAPRTALASAARLLLARSVEPRPASAGGGPVERLPSPPAPARRVAGGAFRDGLRVVAGGGWRRGRDEPSGGRRSRSRPAHAASRPLTTSASASEVDGGGAQRLADLLQRRRVRDRQRRQQRLAGGASDCGPAPRAAARPIRRRADRAGRRQGRRRRRPARVRPQAAR